MKVDHPDKAEHKRRWFQFRLRTMLLATAIFGCLLGNLVHFWPHLLWRFGPSREFSTVRRVPTGPMPITETPDTWVPCTFGSLQFSVPPTLVEGRKTRPNGSEILTFHDARRTMFVYPPESTEPFIQLFKVRMTGATEEEPLSLARVRLAAFETSWDDFRWTMSRRELYRHMHLVALAKLTCPERTQHVETFCSDRIEELLSISGRLATLEWYSGDGRTWGSISFVQRSGDMDLSWVRAVCQTLSFRDEALTKSASDQRASTTAGLSSSVQDIPSD